MSTAWVKPDHGVHIALATDLEDDVPTHIILKAVHEDGHALKWAMTAAETRQFCAALLDHAEMIDGADEAAWRSTRLSKATLRRRFRRFSRGLAAGSYTWTVNALKSVAGGTASILTPYPCS